MLDCLNSAKNKPAIIESALGALYSFSASIDEQVQQYSAFIFANLVLNDRKLLPRLCCALRKRVAHLPFVLAH